MSFITSMPATPEKYMQFYLAEQRYKAEKKAEKKAAPGHSKPAECASKSFGNIKKFFQMRHNFGRRPFAAKV